MNKLTKKPKNIEWDFPSLPNYIYYGIYDFSYGSTTYNPYYINNLRS